MLEVLKLLYLADRRLLRQTGVTLTGDRLVSMPFGPVVSTTYDLMRGRLADTPDQVVWAAYLSAIGEDNILDTEVPHPSDADPVTYDELTTRHLETLQGVWQEYGSWEVGRLINYGHQLPEWEDPRGSSLPIDPVTILREARWSDADIESAREDAASEKVLYDLLPAC
jgi:uncharacterized phage-associated protein